jgi:hypothetical protein
MSSIMTESACPAEPPATASRILLAALACIASCMLSILIISLLYSESPTSYSSLDISLLGSVLPIASFYSIGGFIALLHKGPVHGLWIFTVVFIIKLVFTFILTNSYQGQDERIFHNLALSTIECPLECNTTLIATGHAYSSLLSTLYYIFGVNFILGKLLNVMLGSLIPFLIWDITYAILHNRSTANRALSFTIFLPPFMLYSSMTLKEIPSAFLLILTIWLLMVPKYTVFVRASLALVVTIITYLLRGAWMGFPLTAIAVFLCCGEGEWQLNRRFTLERLKSGIGIMLILGGLLAIPFRGVMDGALAYLDSRISIGTDAEFSTFKQSSSATKSLLDRDNPWSVRNLIIQIARAPFSPSPLTVVASPGIGPLLDALSAITQYILFPFALIGIISSWRSNGVLLLSILQACMVMFLGLSLMLGLTIQRHGIPQFGVLYILASLGIDHWRGHQKILSGWAILVVLFTILYALTALSK